MMRLLGYAASDSDNRMIRLAASRAGWQLIGMVHGPAVTREGLAAPRAQLARVAREGAAGEERATVARKELAVARKELAAAGEGLAAGFGEEPPAATRGQLAVAGGQLALTGGQSGATRGQAPAVTRKERPGDEVRTRGGSLGWELPGHVRPRILAGEADGLVVVRLSRLTNSLTTLVEILDDAYRNRWILLALDVPVGLAALRAGVGAAAELRHEQIAEATRQALAELKDQGVRLGRPRRCPDEVLGRVIADRLAGARLIDICARLNADGIPTPAGAARWYPSHLSRLLRTQDARRFAADR
jgi:hypothetical protein